MKVGRKLKHEREAEQDLLCQVTADELRFADGVARAAADHRYPTQNPATRGLDLFEDDGGVQTYWAKDSERNRAMFAILDQFGTDQDKSLSLMRRVSDLMPLIDDPRMEPYTRPCESAPAVEVRGEIFDVAGEMRCGLMSGLDTNEFFERLAALVKANDDADAASS